MFSIILNHSILVVIFLKCNFCTVSNFLDRDECGLLKLYESLSNEYEKQQFLLKELKTIVKGKIHKDQCFIEKPVKEIRADANSCAEIILEENSSGVYKLRIPGLNGKFISVQCIQSKDYPGPAWTVIYRRSTMKINYNRTKEEYKNGFGSIYGDHFLGLEAIHAMTFSEQHELWISISNSEITKNAKYSKFVINNEKKNYVIISLGNFTGNNYTSDGFRRHISQNFATWDNDKTENKCTNRYNAGWFFQNDKKCADFHLFGNDKIWIEEEFNYAHMMIRPYH